MRFKSKLLATVLTAAVLMASQSVVSASDNTVIMHHSSLGDVNNDGVFTSGDISSMTDYMISNKEINEKNANINSDQTINIVDYLIIKNYVLENSNIKLMASVPSDEETVTEIPIEYNFYYGNKNPSITIDPTEMNAFNTINQYREKYSVRKSQLHYAGHKSAEL